MGYWDSAFQDIPDEICDQCEDEHCEQCEHNPNLNPNVGESMCSIIRFFLDHGFDVKKNDGCFGAQCLHSLTLSSLDRYMITATKMLLDAGAINRTISPTSDSTPFEWMATERSYQDLCEQDHALANIYEAICQVYLAIENGYPYRGIDSYEAAIGQKVHRVFAKAEGNGRVFFNMDLPGFSKDNCYTAKLFFELDNGMLVTTQYADFWTDTSILCGDLIDVSDCFPGIVGSIIQSFEFSEKVIVKASSQYCQPITTIKMDNDRKLKVSINFGEVKEKDRAAFYEII